MDNLRELYQQVILDHNKKPRNYRVMDPHSCKADGHNPLCGDRVTVFVHLAADNEEIIDDLSFQGHGCAISVASASLLTSLLKGKTVSEADQLFSQFHDMVTSDQEPSPELGKLAVLGGVREYPSRVKCATLAWHTLQAALTNQDEPVKTE